MGINGVSKHIPADKLQKYHIQVNEVTCDTVTTGHEQTRINHCAVIYDDDSDFGSVDVIDTDQFQQPELLPSQRIDLLCRICQQNRGPNIWLCWITIQNFF